MPESLRMFIEVLDSYEAGELWKWLDENPYATQEMIEYLSASHPALAESV